MHCIHIKLDFTKHHASFKVASKNILYSASFFQSFQKKKNNKIIKETKYLKCLITLHRYVNLITEIRVVGARCSLRMLSFGRGGKTQNKEQDFARDLTF